MKFLIIAVFIVCTAWIGCATRMDERRATCSALGGTLVKVSATNRYQCVSDMNIIYEVP